MRASLWARRYSCGVSISNIGQLILLLRDRKSTRLNSSHLVISYAVFCLKKKKNEHTDSGHGKRIEVDSLGSVACWRYGGADELDNRLALLPVLAAQSP